MAAPQARFEFVATGDAAVNAQIESVVNKLAAMKRQALDTTDSTSAGMEKARISAHLLNEELGLGIPRAMQKVITMVPGLTSALSAAFAVTAAVGFVQIIDTLIDKMPELANAMQGFGKDAQDAFAELIAGNNAIVKALTDNERQALADALMGLSGSGLDQAEIGQLQSQRDILEAQRTRSAQSASTLRKGTTERRTIPETGEDVDVAVSPTDDALAQASKAEAKVQQLQAQITALDGAISSAGKHLDHDLGDEGAAALDKLRQAAQKARDEVDKIFARHDNQSLTPTEQAINAEDVAYNQELAALKEALDTKVTTRLAYNVRERQLTADHMSSLQKIFSDGWEKIVNAVPPGDGVIPQILFAGLDPFAGMRQSFTDTQRLITQGLEDEAAKEKVVSDLARATGEDQYAAEQKLQDIRGKSATQLQALADKMEQIAHTMGDAGMIAEADKFEAKLQDLRIKTANWSTELKKALNQDMENAFVGIVSGTETVSQAFQNMGQSILAELAKIVYQLYIVKLLQAAIGGLFGGSAGSSGSSVGSGLSSALGSFGGFRASGGPVLPGMRYTVGEAGPETLIMGRHGGMVVPNGGGGNASGGGAAPVAINIHNYGQPMEQSQTSRFDGEKYVVDVVIKNIQQNGPIRQALR